MASDFTIETDRLRMRPVRSEDAAALHTLWTLPEVRYYLFDDEIIPPAFVAAEIECSATSFARNGYGLWCIFPRNRAVLIGFGGYRDFFDPPQRQLFFGMAPHVWGQGLATEAARALIRFGFDHCVFETILASADTPNTASVRVMEKAGMALLEHTAPGGRDTVTYILTRDRFASDAGT